MKIQTAELFCGTKSFSKGAISKGYYTWTIDKERQFNPNVCKDVLELTKKDFPRRIDIFWASPPCTTFSVAGRKSNYTEFVPNNVKACLGLAYVYKTIELIEKIRPTYWFLENPRGYLRKFPIIQNLHRKTVTYCQYGDNRMKPTDIWTNLKSWIPKPICKNGDSCHQSAPRGSKTGTQGLKGNRERSVIPSQLFEEIFNFIEEMGCLT